MKILSHIHCTKCEKTYKVEVRGKGIKPKYCPVCGSKECIILKTTEEYDLE